MPLELALWSPRIVREMSAVQFGRTVSGQGLQVVRIDADEREGAAPATYGHPVALRLLARRIPCLNRSGEHGLAWLLRKRLLVGWRYPSFAALIRLLYPESVETASFVLRFQPTPDTSAFRPAEDSPGRTTAAATGVLCLHESDRAH